MNTEFGRVAQLNSASDFGSEGWGFESLRGHKKGLALLDLFFMFYAYVIRSFKDGRLYKGMTNNLEKRIQQHNLGQNRSTRGFLQWVLVNFDEFETRKEARLGEKYFKSGAGREFLKYKLDK